MRIKTTLILIAIAAIAAAYYFLVEQPRHNKELQRSERETRLVDAFPDAVDRVTIERPDTKLGFDRHDGHWRMTTPVVDRADDSAVNTLLYSIARAEVESRIETEPDGLSEFGLAPPAASVTVEGRFEGDPVVVRLLVGDFSLTKSHCYAGPEGSDAVFLAPAGIRRYALRSIFEFRDKRITDVQVARLERIVVESPTTRVDWRKTRSREWMTVENGDTIRGDSTAVEAIVRTLRGLRAKNMLLAPRDDASEYFTEPRGTVTMWTGDAAPVKVEFGNLKNSRCYVANSSDRRVALVDTTVLRIFRQTVEDFRDKRLLRFAADRTALITVITADRTTTIAQTEGLWTYSNPEFGAIDQNRARRFVDMLRSLEFDAVIEERLSSRRAFGFDDPYLELAVFDANGAAIDRLLVGMNVTGATDRYVTSASSGSLATLSASALDALLRDFDNLGGD